MDVNMTIKARMEKNNKETKPLHVNTASNSAFEDEETD